MAPKVKSKKGRTIEHQNVKEVDRPNWPVFNPLLPSTDLSIEALVPGQIMVIRNFWTSTLCKDYVSFLSSLPLVTTPGKPRKGEAVRVNDRFQIDDADFARRLWKDTALESLVSHRSEGETDGQNALPATWGGSVVSQSISGPS